MKLTRKSLAQLFDISIRTVTTWQADPAFPYPEKSGGVNSYDATAVLRWWRDREVAKLIEGDNGELLDLDQERARLARSQREKVELELRVRREELVEVVALRRELDGFVRTSRDGILAVPNRIASVVAAETDADCVHELMSEELRAALTRLADMGKALPTEQEPKEGDDDD